MGIPTESPLTPGPWKAHRGHVTAEVSTGTWDDEPNRESYGGYLICESVFPGNATAIAAIPQMLKALEACVAVMAKNIYPKPDVPDDHPYAILRNARELIAQVKGKTT